MVDSDGVPGNQAGADAAHKIFRIAVVGGGPVGTVAAAVLADVFRAHDKVAVHVFDATKPSGRRDARAFELWPNALAALHAIRGKDGNGLDAVFRLKGETRDAYPLERYDFRAPSGQLLWGVPTGALSRRLTHPTLVITPDTLAERLRSALIESSKGDPKPGEVAWHAGHELTDLQVGTDPDEVRLEFKVGEKTSTFVADFVIGADGVNSAVRTLTKVDRRPWFPQRAPRRSRVLAIVGRASKAELARHAFHRRGHGFVIHCGDRRFGGWACPDAPDQAVRWLAFLPAARVLDGIEAFDPLFDGLDGLDPAGFGPAWKAWSATPGRLEWFQRRVADELHLFHHIVRDLVRATAAEDVAVHALGDRVPERKEDWFAPRVALLGEPAHPVLPDLGQSCALSFEDAEALGRALRSVRELKPNDPATRAALTTALEAWVEERQPRAREIVDITRAASEAAQIEHGFPGLKDVLTATLGPPMMLPELYRLIRWTPPDPPPPA